MISSEDVLSAVGAEKLSSAISSFSVCLEAAGRLIFRFFRLRRFVQNRYILFCDGWHLLFSFVCNCLTLYKSVFVSSMQFAWFLLSWRQFGYFLLHFWSVWSNEIDCFSFLVSMRTIIMEEKHTPIVGYNMHWCSIQILESYLLTDRGEDCLIITCLYSTTLAIAI